jgi:hypothetical protein
MSTSSDNPTLRLEALGPMTQETEDANPDPARAQAEQKQAEQLGAAEQGARNWGMLMFTIGQAFCMLAPELKPVYSEERCLQFGEAAYPVAEKYGWNGPSNIPELALCLSLFTFALPTWMVIRQRMADLKDSKDGSPLAKLGAWWRNRKAKKAVKPAPDGGGDVQK